MSPPILFLVGLFVAVAIVGGFVAASTIDAASRAQTRLASARDNVDMLLRIHLSEETGLRGFLATNNRSFLQVEGPSNDSFDAVAGRLEAELLNAHLFASRAATSEMETLQARWKRDVERPLLAEPAQPAALALEGRGKHLTTQMTEDQRSISAQLDAAESAVGNDLRWRINATVAVSAGTIALFAIATLVLGLSRAQAVQALGREQSRVSALQQTLRVDGVQLPRTAVGFAYTSATREALVGGDLIDSWRLDAQRGWFLIADASGKGIDAARHSAFVQYAIRTLTAGSDEPAAILARFNRLFLDTFDDPSIFVVLFLGLFDARSGELRYASAGHSITFVVRPRGVEQLAPTGSIIGMDADEAYTEGLVRVETGDTIVLATDGLTESRDEHGEMLGDDGVMALLAQREGEPQAICDRLVAEAERRSRGEVSDDMAILVLRILDPAGVPAAGTGIPFSTMSS